MKLHIICSAVVLATTGLMAVVFTSPGYADSQSTAARITTTRVSDTRQPTVVAPTDNSVKEKLTDNSFVTKAALSNMTNTRLAKIALQKSQNKKLKSFADKVEKSSSAAMKQLKELATKYKLDVPQTPNDDQRKMIAQVEQLTGSRFDRTFVDVMKKEQDTTVGLYDNAAGQGTLNADLRVYAHQQLTTLRKNQKLVHALVQTPTSAAVTEKHNPSDES